MAANANEKLVTEDVIEILDGKILTTRPHDDIGVAARENYDSVLVKVVAQTPSLAQKDAFDNTLTVPSASNPVVLKDDLQTYIPAADLGEVKDSVATFAALPLAGNTVGDLRAVIADGVIYRWNGATWDAFIRTGTLDHTELNEPSLNADSDYQHLTAAEKASLLASIHSHGNLSVLALITDAGSGQIITTAERNRLPSSGEKSALIGTSGLPSNTNRYVTNQDPRLSTTRNPYVTVGPPGSLASFSGIDFQPFEDALVAIDTGSATSVKAIETLPGTYFIGGVVLKWDTQTSALLMEAFVPGTVILSFQTFQAGIQALLPGTGPLTVRGFIFELNDTNTSGIKSQRPNTLIEDCIFRPGSTTAAGQIGVILEGANSVVRRCRFDNQLTKGIEIKAGNCRVEDCVFNLTNPRDSGVHVMSGGSKAVIDHNTFTRGKVKVDSGVEYTQVTNNYFEKDNTNLVVSINNSFPADAIVSAVNLYTNGDAINFTTTGSLPSPLVAGQTYYVRNRTPTQFNLSSTPAGPLIVTLSAGSGIHTATDVVYVLDSGSATRSIENLPEEVSQPFVGAIKTLGPIDSYADYRGGSELTFVQALADPTVKTLEVLPGTYFFASAVTVPSGVKIIGAPNNLSFIDAAPGVSLFDVSSTLDVTIESLSLETTNAPAVRGNAAVDTAVRRCRINLLGADTTDDYGIYLENTSTGFLIEHCIFEGVRGVRLENTSLGRVHANTFDTTNVPLASSLTCEEHQIQDNYFIGALAPTLAGDRLIVEGNHFLGALPTKVNTSDSVWQGNYPEAANNTSGVDTIEVSMDGYLEPLSGACSRSSIAGVGTISFGDSATGSAASLSIKLPGNLNTALGFDVELRWTAAVGSGDVMWEVTPGFRDTVTSNIYTSSSQQQLSSRTNPVPTLEEQVTFSFTTLAYGGALDPTHVSLIVSRLGAHPSDSMTANAHLVDVKISLPRD